MRLFSSDQRMTDMAYLSLALLAVIILMLVAHFADIKKTHRS